MIRMLIVDDEVRIANALYNFFLNQADLELDLYRAYSAEEALQLFHTAKFDLLLSDICMPGMDGLELLSRVKENWPACRVVFLTGYDRFEYAYSALSFDGVSYILKSEGYDALNQRVREQIEMLKNERARRIERSKQGSARLGSLSELLQKRDGQYAFLLAYAPGLSTRAASVLPMLMQEAPCLDAQDGDMYVSLIRLDKKSRLSIRLSETIEDLQRDACEALGTDVALALSGAIDGRGPISARYAGLRARFFGAMTADPRALVQESEAAFAGADAAPGKEDSMAGVRLMQTAQLEQALARQDWREARALTEEITMDVTEPLLLAELVCRINGALMRAARETGWKLSDEEFLDMHPMTVLPSQDVHRLADCWKRWLDTLCIRTYMGMDSAVERAIQIIRGDIAGDLSLIRLSREVNYHPAYFSRMFKNETGETLTDYVTRVRIEEAKRLLGDHRVSDVAAKVGFTSARYFSRVFKEKTGLAPQDWK